MFKLNEPAVCIICLFEIKFKTAFKMAAHFHWCTTKRFSTTDWQWQPYRIFPVNLLPHFCLSELTSLKYGISSVPDIESYSTLQSDILLHLLRFSYKKDVKLKFMGKKLRTIFRWKKLYLLQIFVFFPRRFNEIVCKLTIFMTL